MSGQLDSLSYNELTGRLFAIEREQIQKYVEELSQRITTSMMECLEQLLSQKSKDLTAQTENLRQKLSVIKDELIQDYIDYFKKEESDVERVNRLEIQLVEGIEKAVVEWQQTTDIVTKKKQLQEVCKTSSLLERIPVFNPRREEKIQASRLHAELVEVRIRKKLEQDGPSHEQSGDIWSACARGDLDDVQEAVQQKKQPRRKLHF